ncbi:MAG: FecR/PupR family sigma factor regulator [Exilibacterium sp.]
MSITEAKHKRALNTAIKWLVTLQSPNLSRARKIDFFDCLASSPVHQAAYLEAEQL